MAYAVPSFVKNQSTALGVKILTGAIPLCCNDIIIFQYRLKTQHISIYQQIDNILEFWQHVSAVKSHHQARGGQTDILRQHIDVTSLRLLYLRNEIRLTLRMRTS